LQYTQQIQIPIALALCSKAVAIVDNQSSYSPSCALEIIYAAYMCYSCLQYTQQIQIPIALALCSKAVAIVDN
jgi:hypothetical protein